jgi:hypothetical protein
MKKFISATFVLFLALGSMAAQDSMYVHLKTGLAKFLLADIDSVKFERSTPSTPEPPAEVTREFILPAVSYASLFKGSGVIHENFTDFKVSWSQMNEVYSALKVTHNEFMNVYNRPTSATVTLNGVPLAGASLAHYPLIQSVNPPDVDTYALKYQLTPKARFGTTSILYTFTPSSNGYPVLKLKFSYTVTAPSGLKILDAYKQNGTNTVKSMGMLVNGVYMMQLQLGEMFGFGGTEYRNLFGTGAAGKIDGATHTFAFSATTPNKGKATLTPVTGGSFDATFGTANTPLSGQLLKLTAPLGESDITFNMEAITYLPNGDQYLFPFTVIFGQPMSITSTPGSDVFLTDFSSGACDEKPIDVSNNVTVKMYGQTVYANGAPTQLAVQYGLTASNFTFGVLSTDYQTLSLLNPTSTTRTVRWCNAGTRLIKEVVVGIGLKVECSFASLSATVHNVHIVPAP